MQMKLYQRTVEPKFMGIVDTLSFIGYDKNQKELDIKISGPQLLPAHIDMNTTFEVELTIKYIPHPEPITISIK